MEPSRGDIVSYAGFLFYYEPNGDGCFLYQRKEDVGRASLVVLSPRRNNVQFPPDPEAKASETPWPTNGFLGMEQLCARMRRVLTPLDER